MKAIYIKGDQALVKIEIDQVYFFTTCNQCVRAVFKDKIVEIHSSLYSINNALSDNPNFIRTHKSFIVNQRRIKSIHKYSRNVYNIKFAGIDEEAYITTANLKMLKSKAIIF